MAKKDIQLALQHHFEWIVNIKAWNAQTPQEVILAFKQICCQTFVLRLPCQSLWAQKYFLILTNTGRDISVNHPATNGQYECLNI